MKKARARKACADGSTFDVRTFIRREGFRAELPLGVEEGVV